MPEAVVRKTCRGHCETQDKELQIMEETNKPIKLFDSELKVMNLLWKNGEMAAKNIASALGDEIGWNVNTTYTERSEPNFLCRPLISKREVQNGEIGELVDRLFDGAADQLIAGLIDSKRLTRAEIDELKRMVEKLS